ncbi:hypothetical protein PMG11_09331 [Penicillium brasilianum]|uniref:Tyrosine specific protein phosphatases domain-containing protein n=1 Tax=Penicillium brasilianum TaxID=104259 RepID=A0A0F7TVR8_PENBI|nr:hypothetical protein PMG11_09331 [Penicillium brasilianum]
MTKLSSTDSYLKSPEASEANIEGALNFRSFGGYSSNVSQDAVTREGFIYRSGNLSSITNNGWEKIRELHISTIVNLTDMDEANALYANDAQRSERTKGFKLLHLPLNQKEFDKTSLFTKYCGYVSEGYDGIAQDYVSLLREGPAVIRKILLQIRDYPNEVFIIHCSMGKDRTGVVLAVLLILAGVSKETVSEEYCLSGAALEPLLPKVFALAQQMAPCGTSETDCHRIAKEAIQTSKAVMLRTLELVEIEFGGVNRYAEEHCGLTSEDVELIRHNLVQLRR